MYCLGNGIYIPCVLYSQQLDGLCLIATAHQVNNLRVNQVGIPNIKYEGGGSTKRKCEDPEIGALKYETISL